MIPATYDFSVVRGSAAAAREFSPLIFRVLNGSEALPYDDIRLSVYSKKNNDLKGVFLFRCSVGDGDGLVETDEYAGEVAWFPTTEQTRQLPVGDAYYELELRDGASEVVFLRGAVTGIGGLNDDEGS